jgi:hypothetical protein
MPARGAILTPTLVADPLSNGVFRLWFDPEAGSTYVIEASIDFRTWTPLATNGPVSTWIEYVEANMSSISQFYRARLVE